MPGAPTPPLPVPAQPPSVPASPAGGSPITSTYRLQLTPEFGFDAAADVVAYLADLGVSHLYCSPWLQASAGSRHGYDVTDHRHVNAELGGEEGLSRLHAACVAAGLGIVLDIVPNHASVAAPESANPAWWEVLRDGPGSRQAGWFDIDWNGRDNPGKVLVPVLGRSLADCVAAGELIVDGDLLRYYDHVLPLARGTEQLPVPELLAAQHWRLCDWRVGGEELNYRRFFDVTTLAGLRVEDPEVFAATHRRILASVADGTVQGLRVDHPDGLADPQGYLARLAAAAGGCWTVVEKILEPGEPLPPDWACHGTTGYDALNRITGVFIDSAGEEPLTRLHDEVTGSASRWPTVATEAKRQVVSTVLAAELNRLTELVVQAAWALPAYRDLTRRGLRGALEELLAQFRSYRAYIRPGEPPADQVRAVVSGAAGRASAARPALSDDIRAVAALVLCGPDELVVRFQQTCGPVMAKGVEDTAFYRYGRLLALNEVGGDPGQFGAPLEDFHAAAVDTQLHWPLTMTALSTHDTKRSEDVRARLVLLSEDAPRWERVVTRMLALAGKYAGPAGPDRATQYLMMQTLIGAFPIEADRLTAFMAKATREAKLQTSWTAPDEAYDQAVQSYVKDVLADAAVMATAEKYAGELTEPGRVTVLAMKLLQLTMPGTPDTYQGSELWDLSLVDPDNRRRVDFGERARLCAALGRAGAPAPRLDDSGAAKLHLVRGALRLRRARPELFGADSGYEPLEVGGSAAAHVVAFARGGPGGQSVTVVPRLVLGLRQAGGWKDTAVLLPPGEWTDVFTGRRHGSPDSPASSAYLLKLLRDFPVALLVASDAAGD
jgi:(1->4)-alpha-D-glucan 1-alpha-D-glucosylmutase